MSRRLLASFLLVAVASCASSTWYHYEAVDRPRVVPVVNRKVIECNPNENYELGTLDATWMVVSARYEEGRARVLVSLVVWPVHHVRFQTLDVRLTSLADATVSALVPVTLYIDCGYDDPERHCDRVPVAMQTLDGPVSSSQDVAAFDGVAHIPPEFLDGFLVTLPDVFDGTSRVAAKPLRFERRPGVLPSQGWRACVNAG